jgi:hypothetical protein
MKKKINAEFLAMVTVMLIFITCAMIGMVIGATMDKTISTENNETIYTQWATVVASGDYDAVFETEDGNLWVMKDVDIREGWTMEVTFSDNGTPDILEDDIILDYSEEGAIFNENF